MGAVPDFDQFCRDAAGTLDLAKVAAWERHIEQARTAAEERIVVYANGLVYCSACAAKDLTREDVARLVNELNPCGTRRGWRISDEKFKSGASNPCPCNDHPEERLYWLLDC